MPRRNPPRRSQRDATRWAPRLSFDEWFEKVKDAAIEVGFSPEVVATTSKEAWREYFDEGFTPTAALHEDLRHG